MIPTPSLLERVVEQISQVPMEDRDTKGDLYEYMLSKLTTAGRNGQFRTPRHIIKMMVELMQPRPDDIICDPACGTAGFLVAAGEYLRENHADLFHNEELKGYFNGKLFNGGVRPHKKVEHEEVAYEPPQVIIARLEALEREIAGELAELKGMVGSTPLTDR